MLELSLALLVAAAGAGGVLALSYLRGPQHPMPPLWAGAGHGLLGLAGLALLLGAVLATGPGTVSAGARGFGAAAVVLLGLAAGLGMLVQWLRVRGRRLHGVVIGTHASLAIFGLVVLLAYAFV